jgi:hypothetical protein
VPKDFFKLLPGYPTAVPRGKKSSVSIRRIKLGISGYAIRLKSTAQLRSHGNDARLKELRIPDREETIVQVHITAPKPDRFPNPQAGAVK